MFDETAHPRAPDGKFAAGSGGVASKLKAKGGDLKRWAVSSAASREVGKLPERSPVTGKRYWTENLPKGMQKESWMGHFDKHPWEGGKADAERRATVHEPILHKFLDGVKPAAPGEQKIAVFTMGPPGAGKGGIKRALDSSKFVNIDPDDIRQELPEYKQATRGSLIYRNAAAMSHPEASSLAKELLDRAVAQGNHVIMDGTGSDAQSLIGKMEKLRAAGYHIHLAYAHLGDVNEGLKRIAGRAESTGRYVPEDFARDAYNRIPRNFEEIAKHADTFAVHDTASRDAPVVWKRGEDGQEQHVNPEFVKDFKARFSQS